VRAYSIVITDPATGNIIRPKSLSSANLPATFCSFVNNRNIPGAQNIELDIPTTAYATPMGGSWIRVWGIALDEISQSQDLVGCGIAVYGGMQAGLPLANPKQYGLLAQGEIYQSLGNWESVDQTLDMFMVPSTGTITDPKNIVIDWKANTPMAQAIQSTLRTAFPGYQVNVNISSSLVQDFDEPHFCSTLIGFAEWAREKSVNIIKDPNYFGVAIMIAGTTVNVYDSGTPTTPKTPKDIDFQDFVGQPSWIEPGTISFKTVLRSDVHVGDYVRMPKTLVTVNPGSFIGIKGNPKPTFEGVYEIVVVRHLGNFRQPDGASWVTVFNAFPVPVS
jgi:hypothetical protein